LMSTEPGQGSRNSERRPASWPRAITGARPADLHTPNSYCKGHGGAAARDAAEQGPQARHTSANEGKIQVDFRLGSPSFSMSSKLFTPVRTNKERMFPAFANTMSVSIVSPIITARPKSTP